MASSACPMNINKGVKVTTNLLSGERGVTRVLTALSLLPEMQMNYTPARRPGRLRSTFCSGIGDACRLHDDGATECAQPPTPITQKGRRRARVAQSDG
jgi:hypothetical protein